VLHLGQGLLWRSVLQIVDVPVLHPLDPGWETCLEQGTVFGLFEGDHEVCLPQVEVQYLQGKALGNRIEDAPRPQAGQRMGRDGAGIVQPQLGGYSAGVGLPVEPGLAGQRIEQNFGEAAAIVVACTQKEQRLWR
jgi:hypothetical protein